MTDISTKMLAKAYSYGYSSSYSSGWGWGLFFFWFFSCLAFYAYSAICLMLIAKKSAVSGAWMAWVPILNIYLMCKAAGKSGLWIILFLIPFVNIIAVVLVWVAISERLGRPGWWGILMLVPVANLIIPGILAFSRTHQQSAAAPASAPASAPAPVQTAEKPDKGFCPKCGAKISGGDKFCPDCGAKI